MTLDSTLPPSNEETTETSNLKSDVQMDADDSRSAIYDEVVLLLKADALLCSGAESEAMAAYESAVKAGSVEARIKRGFLKAEIACGSGDLDSFHASLREALNPAVKMLNQAIVVRLHGVLLQAMHRGFISREKQLGLVDVDFVDLVDRIVDYLSTPGDKKAAAENMYETIDAFYALQ